MNVDTSELDALAKDLQQLGPKVARDLPRIVRKGAVNIKNDWREAYLKSRHFRGKSGQAAAAVTFDEKVTPDVVEVEIGPNRHFKIARLAGIAHFGGANGGGGTIGDPQRFLDKEAPGFADALADLVDKALG